MGQDAQRREQCQARRAREENEEDEGRKYALELDAEGKQSSSGDGPSWWLKDTQGEP